MEKCEFCNGYGAVNDSHLYCCNIHEDGWTVVEVCEICNEFIDNVSAAESLYPNTKIVVCKQGFLPHALGKN